MSGDAEKIVSSELASGEQLVWSARPRTEFRLTAGDAFAIPFSLAWCGGALSFEANALTKDASATFVLFGLVFVALGLYFDERIREHRGR